MQECLDMSWSKQESTQERRHPNLCYIILYSFQVMVSLKEKMWLCLSDSWVHRSPRWPFQGRRFWPAPRTGSPRQQPARRLHCLRQRRGLWKTVGGESDHSHQVGAMGLGMGEKMVLICVDTPRVGSPHENTYSKIGGKTWLLWEVFHCQIRLPEGRFFPLWEGRLYFNLMPIQSTHLHIHINVHPFRQPTVTLALSFGGSSPTLLFCRDKLQIVEQYVLAACNEK